MKKKKKKKLKLNAKAYRNMVSAYAKAMNATKTKVYLLSQTYGNESMFSMDKSEENLVVFESKVTDLTSSLHLLSKNTNKDIDTEEIASQIYDLFCANDKIDFLLNHEDIGMLEDMQKKLSDLAFQRPDSYDIGIYVIPNMEPLFSIGANYPMPHTRANVIGIVYPPYNNVEELLKSFSDRLESFGKTDIMKNRFNELKKEVDSIQSSNKEDDKKLEELSFAIIKNLK